MKNKIHKLNFLAQQISHGSVLLRVCMFFDPCFGLDPNKKVGLHSLEDTSLEYTVHKCIV